MRSQTIDIFFSLLRYSLGTQKDFVYKQITDKEWKCLYDLSEKQTMTGVISDTMNMLPDDVWLPTIGVKMLFIKKALVIESANRMLNDCLVDLYKRLKKHGIRGIILKGQGLALLYNNVMSRCPGDIDLWMVDCKRRDIVEFIKKEYGTDINVDYLHVSSLIESRVELEAHVFPSLFFSPLRNMRLRALLDKWKDEAVCRELPDSAGEIIVPSDEMNRVYLLLHIYRHVFCEGIGLRQLYDYALFLKNGCSEEEKRVFVHQTERLNVRRFAAAVMYIMREVFGLEDSLLLVTPDEVLGKLLLDDVMEGGNFGKFKNDRGKKRQNKIVEFIHRNIKSVRKWGAYREEVFWKPLFEMYMFLYRKKENML